MTFGCKSWKKISNLRCMEPKWLWACTFDADCSLGPICWRFHWYARKNHCWKKTLLLPAKYFSCWLRQQFCFSLFVFLHMQYYFKNNETNSNKRNIYYFFLPSWYLFLLAACLLSLRSLLSTSCFWERNSTNRADSEDDQLRTAEEWQN